MAIPLNNHSSSKNFTEQAMSDGIMGSRDFLPRKGHNESIGLPLIFFDRVCLWGKTLCDYFTDQAPPYSKEFALKTSTFSVNL